MHYFWVFRDFCSVSFVTKFSFFRSFPTKSVMRCVSEVGNTDTNLKATHFALLYHGHISAWFVSLLSWRCSAAAAVIVVVIVISALLLNFTYFRTVLFYFVCVDSHLPTHICFMFRFIICCNTTMKKDTEKNALNEFTPFFSFLVYNLANSLSLSRSRLLFHSLSFTQTHTHTHA